MVKITVKEDATPFWDASWLPVVGGHPLCRRFSFKGVGLARKKLCIFIDGIVNDFGIKLTTL
jgi:hypothetical protein